MFLSSLIEAVIGTVVIYILLSLVCSAVNEWLARVQQLRSTLLERELKQLLGGRLFEALARHPMIHGLYEDGKQFPHYIPPSTFALALIHAGFAHTPGEGGLPGRTAVKPEWNCDKCDARLLLESLRQDATELGSLQARIEKWFELSMEQATGRYKRRVQLHILLLSLLMVAAANVDTIAIARYLYAGAEVKARTAFPIGWNDAPGPLSLAGLFLSWAAISLGAPFWFDILNKIVNLRQTGLPPDESERGRAPRLVAQ